MLSHEEFQRYSRHLIMPEVALDGQLKLKAAKVIIVGVGGLGAPLGLYLAAAGIGHIGLVDYDTVDLTNLQRQVIYKTDDFGRSKCKASKQHLLALNPEIEITSHETRLTNQNAIEILSDYDIIVDGSDNFPTRYLVNDACIFLGKPYVYGGIFRFEGQVALFTPDGGPCYRCLFPNPPPPDLTPNCAEGGVMGALPGIIGAIMALETIKLIIGTGESLNGRLLLFDGLKMRFRELKLQKNPVCPVCGTNPSITDPVDYDTFCGIQGEEGKQAVQELEIEPVELKEKLDSGEQVFLLDVREPYESDICSIGGYTIPLEDIPNRVSELDSSKVIVVYCRNGVRSSHAVNFLRQAGFQKILILKGGTNAWSEQIDPTMPKY